MLDTEAPNKLAWPLRVIFATSLLLFLGAALLTVLVASGMLAGRDLAQITPLVVHLILNGTAFYLCWQVRQPGALFSGAAIIRMLVSFLAFGFGAVDLFLSGSAALSFSFQTAGALLFVVPGVAGWMVFDLDGEAKKQKDDGDDAVLAEPRELPPSLSAQIYGIYAAYYAVFIAVLFVETIAGTLWYYVLWGALNEGVTFDLGSVSGTFVAAVRSNLTLIAVYSGIIAALIIAMGVWAVMSGPLNRLRRSFGFGILTDEQRALVNERLRAIWDFANAPGRKSGLVFSVVIPLVLFGICGILALLPLIYSDEIALWLFRQQHAEPRGWYFFMNFSAGALLLVFVAAALLAWSMWRLIADIWPGAAESIVLSGLQRGVAQEGSAVGQTRRMLKRLVRAGAITRDQAFDPLSLLFARWRRTTRVLYVVTALVLIATVVVAWRSLNSYTLATADRIEEIGFFSEQPITYSYREVAEVRLTCTVDLRNETHFSYEVGFKDRSTIELFYEKDLAAQLPAMLQIDDILRRQGTKFVFEFDGGKSAVQPECLDEISASLTDKHGFKRLMHAE